MTKFFALENQRHLGMAALIIMAFLLIRTAWIADDAAITLRTIDNFLHGHGPVFNIGERVQAYTHPLWFLLLSGASLATGNIIITAYIAPIVISIINTWLFLKYIPKDTKSGLLGFASLLLSSAYLDYSTSGLENPLSHLLIILLAISAYSQQEKPEYKLRIFSILGSLIYLTRPDLIILVTPLAFLATYKKNIPTSKLAASLAIGTFPAVAWTFFSTYYYGFPLPNTAYAKLGNGIPFIERIGQGLIYFIDSAIRDPITIGAICTSLITASRGQPTDRGIALGIILYLSFVVSIGGDFMSGRFFTAPLLLGAIIISKSNASSDRFSAIAIIILTLGGMSLQHTLTKTGDNQIKNILATGIADERDFYSPKTGLAHAGRDFFNFSETAQTARTVEVTCGGLGFSGLRGGSELHLIDYCGLSDALLARLPAKYDENWRIGHFSRQLPENYVASVLTNSNQLTDPETRNIYESLRIITQLPLNTPGRIKEIIRMNLDTRNNHLDRYRFAAIPLDSETPAILYTPKQTPEAEHSPDSDNESRFTNSMDIVLKKSIIIQSLEFLTITSNDYLISIYFNGQLIPLKELRPAKNNGNGQFLYHYEPDPALKVPTDRIRLTALNGNSQNIVKHFKIKERHFWQFN